MQIGDTHPEPALHHHLQSMICSAGNPKPRPTPRSSTACCDLRACSQLETKKNKSSTTTIFLHKDNNLNTTQTLRDCFYESVHMIRMSPAMTPCSRRGTVDDRRESLGLQQERPIRSCSSLHLPFEVGRSFITRATESEHPIILAVRFQVQMSITEHCMSR